MRTLGVKLSRADKQRIKTDRDRSLRVIENLDFSRIYDNVPVEVIEGFTIADTETYECFAVFKIQNTGDKDIKALDVRLLLYEGTSNIPTRRINFTYKAEHGFFGRRSLPADEEKNVFFEKIGLKEKTVPAFIRKGEFFGEGMYISLPKSYCRKLEFEIRTVHYTDGTSVVVNVISGKKYTFFKELDDEMRYAYSQINVFARAEEKHPIKIIPQSTSRVWLCCCGRKNLAEEARCAKCGREKDWQLDNITEGSLETELKRIRNVADPGFVHMQKIKAGKQLTIESEEERKKKAEAFELCLKKIAEQERRKEHLHKTIIPRFLLWAAAIYFLIFIVRIFINLQM